MMMVHSHFTHALYHLLFYIPNNNKKILFIISLKCDHFSMTHTVWNAAVSDAEKIMHLIPSDPSIVFIRLDRHLKSNHWEDFFSLHWSMVPQAIITDCLQIIYRLNYCHKVLHFLFSFFFIHICLLPKSAKMHTKGHCCCLCL